MEVVSLVVIFLGVKKLWNEFGKFDNLELFLEHLTLREPGVQI
jgi:hypothetical protein